MANPRKIIIDTDPGQDDAVAILLALASPEVEVLGITAVAGNVPLSLTEVNARKVVELSGKSVKVYAGCDRPLQRQSITAENVHGSTGLDGIELPAPTIALGEEHAVDFIIETVMSHEPKSVTLCPLGPLTNIAAALQKEPALKERLQEIVLMGGAYFEVGNVTPAAEFNIYVDPEAANIVLKSGVPVVIASLDITHKALTSRDWVEKMRALNTPVGRTVAAWTDFFERYDTAKYGSSGAPLHDPCVIAYLVKPELFTGRHVNVEIELHSELTLGMTVADWWGVTKRPKNAFFLGTIDRQGYYDLLSERLATY